MHTAPESLALDCAQALLATLPRLRRLLIEFLPSGQGQRPLTPPQFFALRCLYAGECLPSHLSLRLKVSRPTVTSVVDGLVARGLVERMAEPGDRRRVKLSLTPEGRRLYEECWHALEEHLSHRLSRLTGARQRRLLLALHDLDQALHEPQSDEELPA
ncbi:MAG: MarR family transcriptional regulator [Chloroflexota bacterium]